MPEESINRAYVEKYVEQAKATDNEDIKNNCLYRAGTHLEVIPCNGDDHLTPEQQQKILDVADSLLRKDK